jgi:hypothetical protein
MRVIGRLLVALVVALPISLLVASGIANGDSGSGPAVNKCMHWKDAMTIAPGIGNDPGSQTVAAHGKLFGCSKAGGSAQFTANLQMSAATCDNLAMSGSAQFDWADGGHSSTLLEFHPQSSEPKKVFVSGSVTSGEFQGLIVQAWLRFTEEFSGSGVNCSAGNLLSKLQFTNTQSFQLLTPNVATTTIPEGTSTPTTGGPGTVPQTVPNTNQGGGTTPATNPTPVTVIRNIVGPPTVIIVRHTTFPTGTLAFTGSSMVAAVIGLIAVMIGTALACLDPDRKQGRFARTGRRLPRSFLKVTMPRR